MKKLFSLPFQAKIDLLILIGLFCISWFFSSQDGTASQQQSDRILFWLHTFPFAPQTSFFVRKSAHFLLYMMTGIFSLLFIWEIRCKKISLKTGFLSMLIVLFYAAADEFHQLFVPGRSGQITDVFLDCLGGLCGILLIIVVIRHFPGHRAPSKGS